MSDATLQLLIHSAVDIIAVICGTIALWMRLKIAHQDTSQRLNQANQGITDTKRALAENTDLTCATSKTVDRIEDKVNGQ